MLTEDEWRSICHDLIETGFFDSAGRPRTLKAIRSVMEKMCPDDLKLIREKLSIIFAPTPGVNGQVFPLEKAAHSNVQEQNQRIMVYLSPGIERLSQRRLESIVAHEFAHALLHAPNALEGWFIEQEADQKIRSWGFPVVYPD
ncbi:MAG: hypothetical protein PHY18_05550 [Dehalococcoidales bacterium]|nr:hypothetical protein [Dehalococcoidales bacterium]